MTTMAILLVIVITLLGTVTGFTLLSYLRTSFDLLDEVTRHPALWKQLGEPQVVYVWDGQVDYKTVQPLLPWLSWIWRADTRGLDSRLSSKLAETNRLFRRTGILMALLMAITATLILSSL